MKSHPNPEPSPAEGTFNILVIAVDGEPLLEPRNAWVDDVSASGIHLRTGAPLPANTLLRVALNLPSHRRELAVDAEVFDSCRTQDGFQVRCRWVHLDERT